ncbi:MAG: hypothetical protein PF542_04165 [Nanoarchaeota archaeon]|jgi:hypothetical protein|nr:hypothetical protein [Nanoarchaeota archaeon]
MEEIIQEKISADHLLYVSLKYTKTCDVIMNLLLRWRKMIETCNDHTLRKAQKDELLASIPDNAIGKIREIKILFKDNPDFLEAMNLLMMLRKLENLKTERIGEFRKNVALKIQFRGEEVNVNLEKLKEYAELMEKFINTTKDYLVPPQPKQKRTR